MICTALLAIVLPLQTSTASGSAGPNINPKKLEIIDTGSILAVYGPSKEEADQRLTEVLVALPGIEPGFED